MSNQVEYIDWAEIETVWSEPTKGSGWCVACGIGGNYAEGHFLITHELKDGQTKKSYFCRDHVEQYIGLAKQEHVPFIWTNEGS